MTVPKYKRPAKIGLEWPGVYHVGVKHEGIVYPWKLHCPAPLCFYVGVYTTKAAADERAENHPCPWYGGGTTTLSWGEMSDNYLGPIWQLLDAEVDNIKADGPDVLLSKTKARAYANTLAILMPPFFSRTDEIVKEAMVRWEKRQAGEDYETPGLGRLKWKRPDTGGHDPSSPSWAGDYDPKNPTPPKHNLTEQEIANIKASKMFPAGMLAQAYNTTEEVIKFLQKD